MDKETNDTLRDCIPYITPPNLLVITRGSEAVAAFVPFPSLAAASASARLQYISIRKGSNTPGPCLQCHRNSHNCTIH